MSERVTVVVLSVGAVLCVAGAAWVGYRAGLQQCPAHVAEMARQAQAAEAAVDRLMACPDG